MGLFTMTKSMASPYLAVFICVPILLLSGCGFHLREQTIASPELKTLNVQAHDSGFYYVLESALQSAGVKIKESAPYQVRVLDYHMSSRQTQTTANISNYTVTATVKWTLETASDQSLFLSRTITQNASYQVTSDANVSGSSAGQVENELRQSIVMSIVRQVGAITSDQLSQWKQDLQRRQSSPLQGQAEAVKQPSVHEGVGSVQRILNQQ